MCLSGTCLSSVRITQFLSVLGLAKPEWHLQKNTQHASLTISLRLRFGKGTGAAKDGVIGVLLITYQVLGQH